MGLSNHHDNFYCYHSSHHAWNLVRVGPKKDIIGIGAKTAAATASSLVTRGEVLAVTLPDRKGTVPVPVLKIQS